MTTELTNEDHLEAFFAGVFGPRTSGEVEVFIGEEESVTSRDLSEIVDSIEGGDDGVDEIECMLLTTDDELTGVAMWVPHVGLSTAGDWNGFQPSFVIAREENGEIIEEEEQGHYCVWLLHDGTTDLRELRELSSLLRTLRDDEDTDVGEPVRLPGVDSWEIMGVDPDDLADGAVPTYSVEELVESLEWTGENDGPGGPGGGSDEDPGDEDQGDEDQGDEDQEDPGDEDQEDPGASTSTSGGEATGDVHPKDPIKEFPTSILDRELTLGQAVSAGEREWKNAKWTGRELLLALSKHKARARKDGSSILQGAVYVAPGEKKGMRRAQSMVSLDTMMFDLDTGHPIEETKRQLRRAGIGAILYSTYSHYKSTTEVAKTELVKWLRKQTGDNDPDPTYEDMKSYLLQEKLYNPDILEDTDEGAYSEEHAEKIVCRLEHAPMPKYRIVLFLDRTLVMKEIASDPTRIVQMWKSRYAGLSRLLNLPVDSKCSDPSRLMYTPACPVSAVGEAEVHYVPGNPVVWENIPEVDMRTGEVVDRESDNVFTRHALEELAVRERPKLRTRHLWRLIGASGGMIEIADFVKEHEEDIRGENDEGKVTICCPGDDRHSNPGDPDDMGCFVQNSTDGDGHWRFHCSHTGCREVDRIQFLDEFMQKYDLTIEDLKPHCVTLDAEAAAQLVGEDKMPKAFKSVQEAVDAADALDADTDLKQVEEWAGQVVRIPNLEPYEINEIVNRAVKKTKRGKKDIRAVLSAVEDRLKPSREEEEEEGERATENGIDGESIKVLEKLNKQHFITRIGSSVMVGTEPSDPTGNPSFTRQNDFVLEKGPLKVMKWNSSKDAFLPYSAASAWLYDYEHRRSYPNGVVFEPNRKVKGAYNLWKGVPVEANPEASCRRLLEHVYQVICHENDEWYNFLITWAADILQNPGRKAGSAVVIKGKKGTGKSTFFHFLDQILRPHSLTTSQREHVTGKFNAHMESLLLMVLEEAVWPGDHQGNSTVKDLITNETIAVERKGIDVSRMNNYMRIGMTSNDDWTVPATWEDERRYFVLECSDVVQQDDEWFGPLYEEMEGEGLGALVHYLSTWDPSLVGMTWDSLRTPPKTEWLAEEARQAVPAWKMFFLDWITHGIFPDGEVDGEDGELLDDEETTISGRSVWPAFVNYTLKRGRRAASTKYYSKGMAEVMLAHYAPPRRERRWQIPSRRDLLSSMGAESVDMDLIAQEVEED
jgi:energy-coupling factor transporter ATP-binding protein EcfA2